MRECLDIMKALTDKDAKSGMRKIHSPKYLDQLATHWFTFRHVHHEHARYEEGVLFPLFEAYFPGVTTDAHEQHEESEKLSKVMDRLMWAAAPQAWENVKSRYFVSTFKSDWEDEIEKEKLQLDLAYMDEVDDVMQRIHTLEYHHFDTEELHMQAVGTKWFNMKIAKQTLRKIWSEVDPLAWRIYLPFVVNYNFLHKRRLIALRSFQMAIPQSAPLIGMMVYNGVDEVMWDRLVADVPEFIPRGVELYTKYF